ncbi:unnamed protein product, partial [Amoebophrya sp. A25]|eukprot:GSA25T00000374001.1
MLIFAIWGLIIYYSILLIIAIWVAPSAQLKEHMTVPVVDNPSDPVEGTSDGTVSSIASAATSAVTAAGVATGVISPGSTTATSGVGSHVNIPSTAGNSAAYSLNGKPVTNDVVDGNPSVKGSSFILSASAAAASAAAGSSQTSSITTAASSESGFVASLRTTAQGSLPPVASSPTSFSSLGEMSKSGSTSSRRAETVSASSGSTTRVSVEEQMNRRGLDKGPSLPLSAGSLEDVQSKSDRILPQQSSLTGVTTAFDLVDSRSSSFIEAEQTG